MIQLRRILFPTDFSDNARAAVPYACAFAEQFGAELHILTVLYEMAQVVPESGTFITTPVSNLDEVRESAERALAKLPGAEGKNLTNVVRATVLGTPFLEIIRYARQHSIDLIVMGTHGRGGLAHVLLGSVAERVVRKAPCPVLTVRPEGHQFVMP